VPASRKEEQVPTYQYACTVCDERLEAVQKFTDDPLTTCEACGGPLRKVYSPVGIVFKGSGFYRTDSRNGSGPPGAKDKDKQAHGAGDGSAGKGDSSDAGPGSSADKSGRDKSGPGEAKPAKKAEKAGSSSGTGSKVA
jgi:putative FmdB family regulatory protein